MHNSHFIISTGKSIEDVESSIRCELDGWGNENNWYSIERTVNIDEATEEDKQYIQEILNSFNEIFSSRNIDEIENQIKVYQAKIEESEGKESGLYYTCIGELYKDLGEIMNHKNKRYTLDDLKSMPDFKSYVFDDYGITFIDFDDEDKFFFTEIDMHS